MRKLLLLAALAAAASVPSGAAAPVPPGSPNPYGGGARKSECRSLPVCVPVAGPWVVVPAGRSVPRPQVQFQLSCPRGYTVGGTDAELSDRAIDVAFIARMGAPVNPGITTSADAVFVGTYLGGAARLPSFRPHIGCMPTSGGGSRTPTAVIFPPIELIVRHVVTVLLHPGRRLVASGCAPSERLVDAKSAVGFYREVPPTAAFAGLVGLRQAIRGQRTTASVRTGRVPADTRAIAQVIAICAGGK